MHGRWQGCSRSLSWRRPFGPEAGLAAKRIFFAIVGVIVLWLAIRHFFPTREERLWRFVDATRDAFMEKDEEGFVAAFDPQVTYQAKEGLAEIRRDWKRYRSIGLGAPQVTKSAATLDETGADVRLEVFVVAGLRPVGQARVKLRLSDAGGTWRVTSVSWQ